MRDKVFKKSALDVLDGVQCGRKCSKQSEQVNAEQESVEMVVRSSLLTICEIIRLYFVK